MHHKFWQQIPASTPKTPDFVKIFWVVSEMKQWDTPDFPITCSFHQNGVHIQLPPPPHHPSFQSTVQPIIHHHSLPILCKFLVLWQLSPMLTDLTLNYKCVRQNTEKLHIWTPWKLWNSKYGAYRQKCSSFFSPWNLTHSKITVLLQYYSIQTAIFKISFKCYTWSKAQVMSLLQFLWLHKQSLSYKHSEFLKNAKQSSSF